MACLILNRNCRSWYLSQYVNGKTVVRSLRTSDRAEAEKILALVNSRHVRPPRKNCINWGCADLSRYQGPTQTRRNHILAHRAMDILSDESEKFSYHLQKPRVATLWELGRIPNKEFMKSVATYLCEHRLRSVKARIFIKRARGRCRKVPGLGESIARAIEQHLKLWPDSTENVSSVLGALAIDYRDRQGVRLAA